jgi:hypothetical protein
MIPNLWVRSQPGVKCWNSHAAYLAEMSTKLSVPNPSQRTMAHPPLRKGPVCKS